MGEGRGPPFATENPNSQTKYTKRVTKRGVGGRGPHTPLTEPNQWDQKRKTLFFFKAGHLFELIEVCQTWVSTYFWLWEPLVLGVLRTAQGGRQLEASLALKLLRMLRGLANQGVSDTVLRSSKLLHWEQ